jgi:8-oxo-dGTP diphosphatase
MSVDVVCAILKRGETVMIARRPEGKKLGGLWEFPGGKVELGETPEAALHRELREELGCEVRITHPLPACEHAYDWGSIRLIAFECELTPVSPEPHPHEHSALAWVTLAELSSYELAPADLPVVEMLGQ